MVKSLAAPGKYFQGKDILENLYSYIKFMGTHFIIVADSVVIDLIKEKIKKGFKDTDGEFEFILFGGESTEPEARKIAEIAKNNYDAIIGAGGGKVIDTAKRASNLCGLPVVIIPTVAASDAPCSARSVIYAEDGSFVVSLKMNNNPDVVLVDTMVIAEAPARLLVAGLGDAFATYYEARACNRSGAANYSGGVHSEATYALAILCNDLLLRYGAEAKKSVEKKEWSEALEKIVEANIYLSGIGFENNGCAIAHAIYNGMTAVIKPFPVYHGEGVAYGTLVQLAAEYQDSGQWDEREWNEVICFYKSVGLPLSLGNLGIKNINDELLMEIAEATCTVSMNAYNMPFEVTPKVILNALLSVNRLFG